MFYKPELGRSLYRVQYTHAGHISFLPPSVVVEPVSERVSSEDSMPESRLTAEGGGMGCGLLALLAPARRLLGDEFSELAAEEQPEEEEALQLAAVEELLLMVDAFEAGGGLASWQALLLGVVTGVVDCAWPICETVLHKEPRADFSTLGSVSFAVGGSTAFGLPAALRRSRLWTSSSWMRG